MFRLADSLPVGILSRLEAAPPEDRWAAAEDILDRGAGSRALADPRLARMVMHSLLYFDGQRYDLIAWCVMPTHVHVLIQQRQGWPLAGVVQGWKTFTARSANRILGREGRFWSPDYFDRATKSEAQTERASVYIENNPVAAGLCTKPADWPWSSAAFRKADGLVRPRCGWKETQERTRTSALRGTQL
ncbi:MAG TPA: transposase [Caulobacteraceae bacterium]|nr:transposase [Caulobacteraceae bacterium]